MATSPKQAISAARQRWATARFGLQDMQMRTSRYQSGLMNAVVFGRMVSFALQNMKNAVDDWEQWYEPIQKELRDDPIMPYFVNLRNEIEKQATSNLAYMSAHLKSFGGADIERFRPAPPGATGIVIASADHGGASGWMVTADDGTEELYVIELPDNMLQVTMHMPRAPQGYETVEAADIVAEYLTKLEAVINRAEAHFVRD